MKRLIALASLLSLFGFSNGFAQCPYNLGTTSTVLNGAYVKHTIPTRQVTPYTYLVEREVMWSKRVWREIDLREKINLPMYYPEEPANGLASLWDIIRCNVESGALTAYNPGPLLDDDEFRVAYSPSELGPLLTEMDSVYTTDIVTGLPTLVVQPDELESREIKKYRIKEDWFFDKQRSVMDVRIIGIAPMKEVIGEDGDFRGYAPVFWLYFPECRYVLANSKVYNRTSDTDNMSFEDLFWKRMFSSYIIKESNVFDRNINQYYTGVQALIESEKIKDDIYKVEHDLWHF